MTLQKALSIITNFIFPDTCIRCGRIGTLLCSRCGTHLTFWLPTRSGKHQLSLYPSLKTLISATEYIDVATSVVKSVKFQAYWRYCELMAQLIDLHCRAQLHHHHIDVFVPVPIHPKRKSERGFNQADKLAQAVGDRLQIYVDTTSLVRKHYRQKQSLQDRQGRQSLHHDFKLHRKDILHNKNVCLVDDVFTTGATLSACARAIATADPKKILALTFARAR